MVRGWSGFRRIVIFTCKVRRGYSLYKGLALSLMTYAWFMRTLLYFEAIEVQGFSSLFVSVFWFLSFNVVNDVLD